MQKTIHAYSLSEWVKTIPTKKVLILSNKPFSTKPLLYGEDYYINSIVDTSIKTGLQVDVYICKDGINAEIKRIAKIIESKTTVILHNVSPLYLFKVKLKKKIRVILPIYFLSNRVCSMIDNFRNTIGPFFMQSIVDEYLACSITTLHNLRKLGICKKLTFLPPHYCCPYCKRKAHAEKRRILQKSLPKYVNLVYIGSLKPKRFPIEKIVTNLSQDVDRKYTLTIYSSSQIKVSNCNYRNIEIKFIQRILDEREKCKILSESDVFISPAKNTTMQPPLSVIEAEYHGNLIKMTF